MSHGVILGRINHPFRLSPGGYVGHDKPLHAPVQKAQDGGGFGVGDPHHGGNVVQLGGPDHVLRLAVVGGAVLAVEPDPVEPYSAIQLHQDGRVKIDRATDHHLAFQELGFGFVDPHHIDSVSLPRSSPLPNSTQARCG